MPEPYRERLRRAAEAADSLLCVGLDPDPAKVGTDHVVPFLRGVIGATRDLVCAYKPNFAFFEQYGVEGWRLLAQVRALIPAAIPAIADAKRGDVPHTNEAYARAIFGELNFDACTVSPYTGADSLEPFLAHEDRAIYVLCRTSNEGAGALQNLVVDGRPLYEHTGRMVESVNRRGNAGLVAGATAPAELEAISSTFPDLMLLVPGVGSQGGSATEVVQATGAEPGRIVVNASRQILYRGDRPSTPEEAREAALSLVREMREAGASSAPAIQL